MYSFLLRSTDEKWRWSRLKTLDVWCERRTEQNLIEVRIDYLVGGQKISLLWERCVTPAWAAAKETKDYKDTMFMSIFIFTGYDSIPKRCFLTMSFMLRLGHQRWGWQLWTFYYFILPSKSHTRELWLLSILLSSSVEINSVSYFSRFSFFCL